MEIDRISGTAVNLLVMITVLTVFAVLAVTARRRRITISDVSNGTGRTDLDKFMTQLSVKLRLAVGEHLEITRTVVRRYHDKVRGNASDRRYALELPEMNDALLNRQDETLTSLMASLEAGTSRNIASQLQALGGVVARPRGATVTATFYSPQPNNSRLGISIEVVCPASGFARRHLFWETQEPNRKTKLAERIDTLVQPAARCVAIELATWVLLRRGWFPWRYGGRQRDGLARNMGGLLMNASADEFEAFAGQFREFARDELKAAVTLLPKAYQPHYNLGIANEAEGLAKACSDDRYKFFVAALDQYWEAEKAIQELAEPARSGVKRKIEVRRIHAKLASDNAKFRNNALKWLGEQPLDIERDCRVEEPQRSWPIQVARRGPRKLALDQLTAECLYNSACMYAAAANVAAGHDYHARRDEWDRHARRLLGVALALDTGERYLWTQASIDPDLRRFSDHFQEFLDRLRDAIPRDSHPAWASITEVREMVDDISAATGWDAQQPWWSRVWGMRVLRRTHPAGG